MLRGNKGADVLDGGPGNDTIFGGQHVDTITGGEGDDVIDGGTGLDTIDGGAGYDLCGVSDTVAACEDGQPVGAPDVSVARSYDADGLLATVVVSDTDSLIESYELVWDRSMPVAELLEIDGPGGVTELIRGVGLEAGVTGGSSVAFGRDPLGDITSGPTSIDGFGPYGESTNDVSVGVGYRGELVVAGTVYLRNRSLDTGSGRFMTADGLAPVWGTAATSTYQYAFDNPIGLSDPTGLRPDDGGFFDLSLRLFGKPNVCFVGTAGCGDSFISDLTGGRVCGWRDSGCTTLSESHPWTLKVAVVVFVVASGVAAGAAVVGGGVAVTVGGGGLAVAGGGPGAGVVITISEALAGVIAGTAVLPIGITLAENIDGAGGGGSTASSPTSGEMIGENGQQIDSVTLLRKGPNRVYRIDVENPAPGGRPGQIHLQIGKDKYLYNFETGTFDGAPNWLLKQLAKDPKVPGAIAKGLRYLGL